MKKNFENYIRKHCNIEFSKTTGEEVVNSSLSAVMIAFDDYNKDMKSSLDYEDFGFGDACGDAPDNCYGGNCRRPDKSI